MEKNTTVLVDMNQELCECGHSKGRHNAGYGQRLCKHCVCREYHPREEEPEKSLYPGMKYDSEKRAFFKSKPVTKSEDFDVRIGMLRQWLNEDRITDTSKMVTNDDIKYWLGMISDAENPHAR